MSTSPAAVCQCLTLVSLCTSIADPNWITVTNGTQDKQLIYGVAFTLHAAQNLTDTGPLGGVHGWGMWLLYALAALCYSAVLVSSCSFLLDFLGAGVSSPRLLVSLYVSTVALLLSILGVWGACLYIIHQNLQAGKLWPGLRGSWGARNGSGRLGSGAPPRGVDGWGGVGAAAMRPIPGESFYIAVLALFFSGMASAISINSLRETWPGAAQGGYSALGPEEEERGDPQGGYTTLREAEEEERGDPQGGYDMLGESEEDQEERGDPQDVYTAGRKEEEGRRDTQGGYTAEREEEGERGDTQGGYTAVREEEQERGDIQDVYTAGRKEDRGDTQGGYTAEREEEEEEESGEGRDGDKEDSDMDPYPPRQPAQGSEEEVVFLG